MIQTGREERPVIGFPLHHAPQQAPPQSPVERTRGSPVDRPREPHLFAATTAALQPRLYPPPATLTSDLTGRPPEESALSYHRADCGEHRSRQRVNHPPRSCPTVAVMLDAGLRCHWPDNPTPFFMPLISTTRGMKNSVFATPTKERHPGTVWSLYQRKRPR